MSRVLKLTYHGTVLSKKNSKRIIRNHRTGAPMMVSNKSAKANEDSMIGEFRAQTSNQDQPFECCIVDIGIFEPNLQRRDIDNQATSILDALVQAGVIVDDGFKCVQGMIVRFEGIDRKDPRAEIKIVDRTGSTSAKWVMLHIDKF